jgi:hypothetical protein
LYFVIIVQRGGWKLAVSFTLDVNALAASGFRWSDDGQVTRKRMMDAFLEQRK